MADKPIILNNWQSGIGQSPVTGFGDMRNVEIHDTPGILKIAKAPYKISSTTVLDLPTWMTADYSSTPIFYFGGYQEADNVYKISSGTVTTIGASNVNSGTIGGAVWKGYVVIVDYNSGSSETIDLCKISDSSWTNAFKSLTSSNQNGRPSPVIWAQDDILYIGHGRYVASLREVTTFDPTDAGSYSWTEKALTLPEGFHIESFAELGKNLMIGASKYTGAITQDTFEGKIFPWDRSATTFTLPINLDRGGVRQMISRNGLLAVANGSKGNFISTSGTFTEDVKSIGTLDNLPSGTDGEVFSEAKAFVNGEYLFGVSTSDTDFVPAGIYGFKNGAWRFLSLSTGEVGANDRLRIGVIFKKNDSNFYVGWQDDETGSYGIDEFGYNNYRYTGYSAYVDSPLYQIGTSKLKRQLQTLDFTLAKPLTTGQGIKISYRTNLNDSFTVIGTYDYATLGDITNHHAKCTVPATDQVQFRVALTTGTSSTTTPELKEVIFY